MSEPVNIAHYRVLSKLGEGGMGVVYRAADTKLNRDVAIKMLNAAFVSDPNRMARFQREAQVLASLSHPNIAAIFGIEENALVMELVPGPTLEQRIAEGPIPPDEARDIARQIAEGLEAAHERGIVHRDLKPANVKLPPDAPVKLLDFGLAKASDDDASASGMSMSPTMSLAMTQAGMIMGTAGYMSPEQAAGKTVDKRADVWSFGVVLFEMFSGKRLFEGETIAHTLADVLRAEIDLKQLPESTPSAIRKLIGRCLERNVKKRLRDIGEARIILENPLGEESDAAPVAAMQAPRSGIPMWAGAAFVVAIAALGFFLWRATRPAALRPMMRLSVDLGPDAVRGPRSTVTISPDGTRIVFPVRTGGAATQLATRLLDQPKANVLAGTEGGVDPFFSPDGQWIGFFTGSESMKKISVNGGAAVTLCTLSAAPRGGAWGDDGYIYADIDNNNLFRIPEVGGKPEMLADTPANHGTRTWRWPQILPDGKGVLFTAGIGAASGNGYEDANLEVLSLKTGKHTVLHRGGYFGRYLPSGHLVFVQQGTLFAVPLDLDNMKTRGSPAPVLEDVSSASSQGAGQFDFSSAAKGSGVFVYQSGKPSIGSNPISWLDAPGKTEPIVTSATLVLTPSLSPDGRYLAFSSVGNILVHDMKRGATTPITNTTNGQQNSRRSHPVWTPDGKHIAYIQFDAAENGIWWIRADGSGLPRKLIGSKQRVGAFSISPDGRRIAYGLYGDTSRFDIWILSLDLSDPDQPKPGTPELYLKEPDDQSNPTFSPDGRWLAYQCWVGGRFQIEVRPFPASASGGRWQVSIAGGVFPIWSAHGKELRFLGEDDRVMAAAYTAADTTFSAEKPRPWSPTQILRTGLFRNFDISADGKRIVAPIAAGASAEESGNLHATVLLNFFDELKRRLPL